MQHVSQLGRSGVHVTRLGLGGGPLASLFTEVTEEQARATIDRAWDAGIRFFDTAPLYGHGLSEIRFGRALRGRPRDEFVIASKAHRAAEPRRQTSRNTPRCGRRPAPLCARSL